MTRFGVADSCFETVFPICELLFCIALEEMHDDVLVARGENVIQCAWFGPGPIRGMFMGQYETGQHSAAIEIELASIRSCQRTHLLVRPHGQNLVIANRHGFGDGSGAG